MLSAIIGVVCLVWYIAVLTFCVTGCIQMYVFEVPKHIPKLNFSVSFRHYRHRSAQGVSESLSIQDVPHITVIRPIKGLEPDLYQCLAATFHQTYPRTKLTIYFCISSRGDASLPILERLLLDFPAFDAHVLVEDEDPALQPGNLEDIGPNPKIRNMSRAYREAKGDIVWIMDCNVWVGRGVAGRMVDVLCGFSGSSPYKFVHQLPLVVDITETHSTLDGRRGLLNAAELLEGRERAATTSSISNYETVSNQDYNNQITTKSTFNEFGGRLDELFLSSSHAKFYTAINTIAIAPCIVGKSNMFRRSHLDNLTNARGIDYFSHNICEDHLIGDLLWRKSQPFEADPTAPKFGRHAMLFGDLAIQPTAHMSVGEYVARRVRWLRVRKFTVALATLVEPGTESLLCSAYGAYAVTSLPWFEKTFAVPPTWTAFAIFWLLSVSAWILTDWIQFGILQGMRSIEVDDDTPSWARGPRTRSFSSWVAAWLGRELLALPVWTWAVWGGVTVSWRGRRFKVGMDMRVRALDESQQARSVLTSRSNTPRINGHGNGKARTE